MSTEEKRGVCLNCGKQFDYPVGSAGGRPPGFCSPKCRRQRRNAVVAQQRASACPPEAHGTITGYNTYGCSCDRCRAAEAAYMRERRKRKKAGD